jgi:hypothetical protein
MTEATRVNSRIRFRPWCPLLKERGIWRIRRFPPQPWFTNSEQVLSRRAYWQPPSSIRHPEHRGSLVRWRLRCARSPTPIAGSPPSAPYVANPCAPASLALSAYRESCLPALAKYPLRFTRSPLPPSRIWQSPLPDPNRGFLDQPLARSCIALCCPAAKTRYRDLHEPADGLLACLIVLPQRVHFPR